MAALSRTAGGRMLPRLQATSVANMTYAHPDYLAETEWLEQRLGDPKLRLFDVTGMLTRSFENLAREKSFDLGHIPTAGFLDIAGIGGALSDPEAKLPWTWPTPDRFEEDMRRAGVENNSTVVVYAATPRKGIDVGLMWATRAWWVMHHHDVDCRVLNGGWEKWLAEDRPISTRPGLFPRSSFKASTGAQRGVASSADVLAAVGEPGATCVVDALSEDSFSGSARVRYGPRKGHIAGAVNVPMTELLDETTGVFRPAADIREAFERVGFDFSRPAITYCGGGIAATVDAFALKLCGMDAVRVYDGSLAEWSADPALPMVDPSAPSANRPW
jgi:thiosulfate/3-mercaptopyruvate sulfurtransferase